MGDELDHLTNGCFFLLTKDFLLTFGGFALVGS